jgi:hypothetical protein
MLAVLIALVLLAACVAAIYLLLKNMGENGIEAAAPGSCRSGRCGVQAPHKPEAAAASEPEHYVLQGELKRLDFGSSDKRPNDQP